MGSDKKKILWITNIPSPYRVDFFNELGKKCDLTVLFARFSSAERDESWKHFTLDNFEAVFLKGWQIGVDGAFCPGVLKYIKKKQYHHVIVSNFYDLTGMLAIICLQLKRIPYIIETDGGFAGSGKGIKEEIKKHLLGGASLYFSTAKEHDEYYKMYGAENSLLVRYPFSSLRDADIENAALMAQQAAFYREKLGLQEKHMLLSVGRFSYEAGYGKGYDILMNVSDRLGPDYGVYIVGDEPTEEFLRMKSQMGLHQVHFVGFKKKEELAEYYAAADCFVFLSRKEAWGLVINEAMAYGLPIISSKNCIAASELVRNGENGYLIDLDDISSIADHIKKTIEKPDTKIRMGMQGRKDIAEYTVEKMAAAHSAALGLEKK